MPYNSPNHIKDARNKFADLAIHQNLMLCMAARELYEMNEQINDSANQFQFNKPKSLFTLIKEFSKLFYIF